MRIYLDAAPIIYVVERVSPYLPQLLQHFSLPDTTLVTSDMARLECRMKPLRDNNVVLLSGYDRFFKAAVTQMVPLTTEVIDLATEIRAQFGFGTPDAIHLAAATVAGCDEFLTNDHRLRRFDRLHVVAVSAES